MTNFQLAKIIENQYDEWLAYPHTWVYSQTFKRASSRRWVVKELAKRLRTNASDPPNYICENFYHHLVRCYKLNPKTFYNSMKTMEDILDFINCLEN